MASTGYIYQCESPECGLRFPGFEGHPRFTRCPICRSGLRIVEILDNSPVIESKNGLHKKIPVDVLLDNIRSALNVGSIFRSAEGTGIQKIYCCGITPTPDNPKVRKTALGAESYLTWESNRNGLATAQLLKEKGYSLWALEHTPGAELLYHVDPKLSSTPLILIVGNEVSGVDPGIIKICDKVISIPMLGEKKSYNVAISFSIATSFLLYRFWDII